MSDKPKTQPSSANGLLLAWRLARREMRTGLHGFRVFIACLALGVAAIAAVSSLSESVKAGLMADARILLGGDVSVRMQHTPIDGAALTYLKDHAQALSSVVEMKAMAQTDTTRALVELKAVDTLYPLTGRVELEPAGDLQSLLLKSEGLWGAIVERGLLAKLDLDIGASVRVGEATFQIRGVIAKEPDRVASIVNFGPRFMVATAALPDTALVQLGSQIRYYDRVLLAPKENPKTFIENLDQAFPEAGWRVNGPDNAAPGLQRFIDRLTLFLTFAGLTALLVGGIGVLGGVRSYLETKTETIATLKCLGAPGGLVFQAYLFQVLTLSAVGITIGLLVGAALPFIGIELVRDHLPVAPQAGLYPFALLKAMVFGILVSVTFALWPLAQARETPAANLFRTNVMPSTHWPKLSYLIAVGVGVFMLGALVVVWAEERNFAYWFVLVSLGTVILLRLGASVVMAFAKRATHPAHAPNSAMVRLVLANLHRPGTATPGVVLALGVGLTVLVAVALIQGNITRQVQDSIPDQAPAFFFIDIQPHQVADFDAAVTSVPSAHDLLRMPSLRGRIVAIKGVPVDEAAIDSGVRWAVRGDRALTYAATPSEGTEFTDGAWWAADYQGAPLISFDADVAKGFGVGVGDSLTINVLGRDITAKIASLRKIDWRTLRFDFAIIFAPGTLEGAPHTHIAAIKAPPSAESIIERQVAVQFPNVSTIRVRDALDAANRIIQGIGVAVSGTASVTVLAGIIVLAGTIAAARTRRVYDSVVFKVLGATRKQILGAFLLEYGVLGLFTGIIGALVGTLISWAVIDPIMGMRWVFLPLQAALTVAGAMAFTTLAGFFGTWRALGERASGHLRNE